MKNPGKEAMGGELPAIISFELRAGDDISPSQSKREIKRGVLEPGAPLARNLL